MSNGADQLVDRLIEWEIEIVFGLPGDGINGIMESLRRRSDDIRFIQVRHEESAAFMACAYAKVSGKIGCCLATSGPGGLHLLNGLYDAKLDRQPVLAITGMQYHDLIGTYGQQDVSLDKVFSDVAVYNERIMGTAHISAVVDLACKSALTKRGVAHITIPIDFQLATSGSSSDRNVKGHSSAVLAIPQLEPVQGDVIHAAALLNKSKRPVILAGRGALHVSELLETLAAKVGAPIVKPLLGKAAVSDDSPYTTGGIGLLGTLPSIEAMESCDTLLILGSSFPYIEFYPKPGKAKSIQVDIDATRIGVRYPVDIPIVGYVGSFLQELLPFIEQKQDKAFLESCQEKMKDWNDELQQQSDSSKEGEKLKPQTVAFALNPHLPDDAIIALDTGNVTLWGARFLKSKIGHDYLVSGNLASMANALPYAIAAQVACPERMSVALAGDGGFSMLMAEFATAVKYNLPIKVIVFRNDTLGMIKFEQIAFLGNPEYQCDLQPIDFATFAQSCGGVGLSAEDASQLDDGLRELFQTEGPALLQCIVDPNEAPLPPKISVSDAVHFAEAMVKGQPGKADILKAALPTVIRQLT